MKAFNSNLVPPGGFVFRESDGVELRALTLEALIQGVRRYREARGRPLGNPEFEVHSALCARFPTYCREVVSFHAPKEVEAGVAAWAARWVENPPERVSDSAVIQRRTALCLKCPARVEWASGCAECRDKVWALLAAHNLLNGPTVLRGSACLLARDDLSVAVQLRDLERVQNPPATCWRSATGELVR